MKKLLLIVTFAVGLSGNAQSTLFQDSFETYTNFAITGVGSWTLTDVDLGTPYTIGMYVFANSAVPKSFQVFNPAALTPILTPTATSNWTAKTGVQSMVCFNKASPAPAVNDDWMISPSIILGTANTVKFWGKGGDNTYPAEKFNVYVSSTTTAIASFVKISGATAVVTASPGATWREYTYAIPASYDNAPVFVAIQCVSDDQYGFLVDDFSVTGTVACPAPFAGTAAVTVSFLTADLSWTSGGATTSELVYQVAGTGTPATAPGTGTIVTGTTFSTPTLVANTNYEFYVRDICTTGTLYSSWSSPYLFNTISPPDCATLNTPADNALNVPLTLTQGTGANAAFKTANGNSQWTASVTGSTPADYNIYLGTSATTTALLGTLPASVTGASLSLLYDTTYFWKAIPKNISGEAAGCSTFSFKTAVATSCLTNVYAKWPTAAFTVTLFTGVPAVISAFCYGGEYSEVNVTAGTAYNFSSSVATDYVTISADAGLTSVAFGMTSVTWVSTITGVIRFYTHADNKCSPVNVNRSRIVKAGPSLATDTFVTENFKSFPNPVKEVLNLSYDKEITSVSIINLLGQEVLSAKPNSVNVTVDMSSLTAGAYLVKLNATNEIKTIKVVKE